MQKQALLASLLTVLSACAEQRVIGTAYVDAGDEVGFEEHPDVLVAAAQALDGDWKSPTVNLPMFGGMAFATFSFKPDYGHARGTYVFSCPARCAELLDPQGGERTLEFGNGRYVIVGRTKQNEMRGVMFSDDFATGFVFNFPDSESPPPDQIGVELLVPVTFERIPEGR